MRSGLPLTTFPRILPAVGPQMSQSTGTVVFFSYFAVIIFVIAVIAVHSWRKHREWQQLGDRLGLHFDRWSKSLTGTFLGFDVSISRFRTGGGDSTSITLELDHQPSDDALGSQAVDTLHTRLETAGSSLYCSGAKLELTSPGVMGAEELDSALCALRQLAVAAKDGGLTFEVETDADELDAETTIVKAAEADG